MTNRRWVCGTFLALLAASCSGRDGEDEDPLPDRDAGPDTHDADGDGAIDVMWGGDDCNDTDPSVHPGAVDSVGDGVDQDCSGWDGVDADYDGHPSIESGGDDCDDARSSVHPGIVDVGWVGWTFVGNGVGTGGCWNYAGVSAASAPDGGVNLAFYCWAGDGTAESVAHATVSTTEPVVAPTWTTVAEGMFDFRMADGGAPIAIAMDGSGAARVAWQANVHQGPSGIMLGAATAEGASSEQVDWSRFVDDIALALDADGAPHLAWADDESVTYATPLGDGWYVQQVQSAERPAGSVAITVDASGATQILYRTDDGGVGWSRLAQGWTHASVDGVEPTSPYDRVALTTAPDGAVHAVWGTTTGFAHAVLVEDVWQIEEVSAEGGVQPSIAVGGDGRVFVAHLGAGEEATLLSTGPSGDWTTEVVSTPIEHDVSASATAVALGSDAAPVVASWYGGMYGSIDVRWRKAPDGVDDDCDGVVDDGGAP